MGQFNLGFNRAGQRTDSIGDRYYKQYRYRDEIHGAPHPRPAPRPTSYFDLAADPFFDTFYPLGHKTLCIVCNTVWEAVVQQSLAREQILSWFRGVDP